MTYAGLGNYIADKRSVTTVEDGSGNILSQTTTTFDQGTVQASSGTPQHVAVSGSRGNPTSITYLTSGSNTISKSFTYYDTGTVYTTTDVNGALFTNTYGSRSPYPGR